LEELFVKMIENNTETKSDQQTKGGAEWTQWHLLG
jgi:hypothetical protein